MLNNLEKINKFFKAHPKVILVIHQLNALEKKVDDSKVTVQRKSDAHQLLQSLMLLELAKAILSSSSKYHSILRREIRQLTNENIMYIYNGLTRANLIKNN